MKKNISRMLSLMLTVALLMGCFSAGIPAATALGNENETRIELPLSTEPGPPEGLSPIINELGYEGYNVPPELLTAGSEGVIRPLALGGEVEVAQTATSLSIGNDLIVRSFDLSGGKVKTSSIENLRSGITLTPEAGSEDFIINVTDKFVDDAGGKDGAVTAAATAIKSSDLTLAGAPIITTADGSTLVVFTFAPYSAAGTTWTILYKVSMTGGNHYMNSWLEISVPEADRDNAFINVIDVDKFNIGAIQNDLLFSCREDIVNQQISQFQQRNGQPLYVNSLFFGVEFQISNNRIVPDPNLAKNDTAEKSMLMRYYSGRNFTRLENDGRLVNGAFRTWPAVLGAAHGSEYEVVQDDFYDYVNAIAQGTYYRTQFNTWYDGGMNITPQSITNSYMNIEQGLTQAGLPPINAYICDDGYNDYSAPFWGFKGAFANNVLKDISQMMTDAGGSFGKWISPRGGYGVSQSPFLRAAGTGFPTSGGVEICAGTPVYLDLLFKDMCWNMDEYNVNYWKLDGMARDMCTDVTHGHVTGGKVAEFTAAQSNMWMFTALWEEFNAMFLGLRAHQAEKGKSVWLNSTGSSIPSPWYLLIVNSIKVITSGDTGRAGPTTANAQQRQSSFRDTGYWRFFNSNKFQFPYNYIWNHDPVYALGDESGYQAVSPAELRRYLFNNAMRGVAIWELLFSPSVFSEGHWLATNDAMSFSQANQEILKHVRMVSDYGEPAAGNTEAIVNPYVYSAWVEQEGYVSFRNPKAATSVTMELTLDTHAGVKEGMHDLSMTYILPSKIEAGNVQSRKATYNYGDIITINLAPLEQVIVHFAPAETDAPELIRTEVLNANTLRICFNEWIELEGTLPAVAGHTVTGAVLTDDAKNVDITVSDAFTNNEAITLTSLKVKDMSGNLTDASGTARYAKDRLISEFASAVDLTSATGVAYDDLLQTDVLTLNKNTTSFAGDLAADETNVLTVASLIQTTGANATILEQAGAYSISLTADGKVEFTAGGLTVVSKQAVNDGNWHHFVCVKEPNEMIKVYIDGKISASAYEGYNLNILKSGAVTLGSAGFTGKLSQLKVFNKSLGWKDVAALATQPLAAYDLAGYDAFTVVGLEPSLPDTVQARYDTTGYFRNYDADWAEVIGNIGVAGKVDISGTLPGFDGDRAVNGTLSVIDEWPSAPVLTGTNLSSVLGELEASGWEILNRADSRLGVNASGLAITASPSKMDRGNLDPTDATSQTILPDVVNENFFLIDPGMNDYTAVVTVNGRGTQMNKSAGLIIREDDDNYVRMTYRISGNSGNGATSMFSLHVENDGRELTLEEPWRNAAGQAANISANAYLALEKKGEYYTGYFSNDGVSWLKLGTVKAQLTGAKAGFHATTGIQDVPGFSTTAWSPRFSDFNIRQYSVGLTIDPATAGALEVVTGDPAPRYAWANTTFSDGSRGSLLIELPAIDTSLPGEQTVQGTVAGGTTTVPMTVTMVGDPTPQYTITFEANGGTDVEPITMAENGTIDEAPVTTRAKYEFEGWYTDEALTEKVIFPYTVTEDATLFAKWVRIPTKVIADIRGSTSGSLDTPVEYIISLLGMEKVLNASITFEVDESMLEGKGLELLSSGFTALDLTDDHTGAIRWTNMGNGVWQGEILLMNFAADGFSSDVAVDVAKVIYAARQYGDATMKLTKLEVVGIDENDKVVYLNSEIKTAEATTSIVKVYSIYDLNKDGVVDALDLGIVQRYYQATMSSDNWDAAKACDFNNDGCVDIKDLIELFRQYAR